MTVEEYESRGKRYDNQLKDYGCDTDNITTEEKIKILRKYREEQYQRLCDGLPAKRMDPEGVPTLETIKRLGIDYPDVIDLVSKYL